jgi:sugar-specific transcriptional regulator TrmB
MTQNLISLLQSIGFDQKEAKIYLASIELGPASILEISNKSKIKRANLYNLIKKLKEKGVINIITDGWKQKYSVISPNELLVYYKSQQKELENNLKNLNDLRHPETSKNKIKTIVGKANIRNVYLQQLEQMKTGDVYLTMGNMNSWYDIDGKFFEEFKAKRAAIGVQTKNILTDSDLAKAAQTIQKKYKQNIKILDKSKSMSTNLVLFKGKIYIHQLDEQPVLLEIENHSFYQMMKEMFGLIWEGL